MNSILLAGIIPILSLLSCSGGGDPGYLFHIIFIIIPLILTGHYIYRKFESSDETLYVIEGQLKRIISKLEKLERETGQSSSSSSSKSGKNKKEE